MGLSVEATSLYLLMISLSDGGMVLARENLARYWNASDEALTAAIRELMRRGVIEEGREQVYHVRPSSDWRSA
jgi:hypothetical protein